MSIWISNKEGNARVFMSNDITTDPAAYFKDFHENWKQKEYDCIEDALRDMGDGEDIDKVTLSLPYGLTDRLDLVVDDMDVVDVTQETLSVILVMMPEYKHRYVKAGKDKEKLSNIIVDRLNNHLFKHYPCNVELHVVYYDMMTNEEIKLYSKCDTRKEFCKSRGFDENSKVMTCVTSEAPNIGGGILLFAVADITTAIRFVITETLTLVGEENDKTDE